MISQTILFKHLYQNPPEAISFAEGNKISDEALKSSLDHFYDFYEEIFIELSNLGELKELGSPVLLGTSKKSVIGNTLDLPPKERVEGTIATTVLGIRDGVDIVRVHDVKENLKAAKMADAIYR